MNIKNFYDCLPLGVRPFIAFQKKGETSFTQIFADNETGALEIKHEGIMEIGFTLNPRGFEKKYRRIYNYRHNNKSIGKIDQFDPEDAAKNECIVKVQVKITRNGDTLRHERYPKNGIRIICFRNEVAMLDIYGIGVTQEHGKLYVVCQNTYNGIRCFKHNGNIVAEVFRGRKWDDMQALLAYAYEDDMTDINVPQKLSKREEKPLPKLAPRMIRMVYFNKIQGYGRGVSHINGHEESVLVLRDALPENKTGLPRSCEEGEVFYGAMVERPGAQSRTDCQWVAKKVVYPRKEGKPVTKKTIREKPEAKPVAKKTGEKKKEQKTAPNGKAIFGGLKNLFK